MPHPAAPRRKLESRPLPLPRRAVITSPVRQIALQGAAALVVLSLAWPTYLFLDRPFNWPLSAAAIGAVACVLATLTRQHWWWRLIHLLFTPLAVWVASQGIDPGWFLAGFVLLLLVFRSAALGQIPLYLSGKAATEALAALIRERHARQVADLGAGIGSAIVPLARALPEVRFVGIENSPLPWLLGWLRTRGLSNVEWRWGSLWASSLAPFDVVYAFLSPTPMPSLWEKACAEMQHGSLLVSNSFAIPGVTPVWQAAAGSRELFGYQPRE